MVRNVASSLQINVLLWLAECPHEWGGPVCLENTLTINIVVVPSGLEFFLEVLVEFLTFLTQMRLNDLSSEGHGLIMGNEELTVWQAFLGNTFGGVVRDNISSELVNWNTVSIVKMAWYNTIVGVFPLSIIVIISDESVKGCWEALKIWLRLLESLTLGK